MLNWKKILAAFVIIAFVWAGLAWAAESDTPQFQEKPGTPVVKKHKKFPVLLVLLGAVAIGAGVYFLTKKKTQEPQQKYTITVAGRSVENIDEVVGGDITFKLDNGTTVSGSNSSSFVFDGSNKVVDASVSGQGDYFPGYLVFKDESGAVLGYKDANGMKSFTVSNNQKIFAEYIKNAGFDIKLLGQCLNKNTVKGYDKEIPIGIMNDGAEPVASDYTNLENVVSEFNKYSKVKMVYVGKVNALLDKGITVRIGKNYFAGHWEKYNGNFITNSEVFLSPGANYGLHLEEEVQAALGGGDGPFPNWPGRTGQGLNAFGKRHISLNYSLPFGFVISGDTIPASAVYPMSSSSLHGAMQGSGALPGIRAPSHYNSPGNKATKE